MKKFKNRKFPTDFEKISDWINRRKGVSVSLGHETNFNGHFTREISIHHNFDLEKNGLYALLHECGHALQPPTNIGVNSYKNLDAAEYPERYRFGRFMSEMDAWKRGYELSKQLNIHIDKLSWDREKENSLITYFI